VSIICSPSVVHCYKEAPIAELINRYPSHGGCRICLGAKVSEGTDTSFGLGLYTICHQSTAGCSGTER
jgi:hypothetical protein